MAGSVQAPPPRPITYHDNHSPPPSTRSSDGGSHSRLFEELRARDEQKRRENLLDELKLQRELRSLEHSRLPREDFRSLDRHRLPREEYGLPPDDFITGRTRDDFVTSRARDDFIRPREDSFRPRDEYVSEEELRMRNELRHAEEIIRRDSEPYAQIRDPVFTRRNTWSELPLDGDRPFNYVRNPFAQQRRSQPVHRF
jgi:hypothetical protein